MADELREIMANLRASIEENRRRKKMIAQLAAGNIEWNGKRVILLRNPDDWKIESLGFLQPQDRDISGSQEGTSDLYFLRPDDIKEGG